MKAIERYQQCIDEPIDLVLMRIKKDNIKCGRYAKKIKIDKNILKQGEYFNDKRK